MNKTFRKILVANRGEIAVRIIRTCREMGIISVAVYSDVDRRALHVRVADEAYLIGAAKPSASYLNIDKIIGVAKKCRAQAIHPGYGFLAENPNLVKRCEKEGIVFIGPPSKAMEIMGSKTASRAQMAKADVPIIPGTLEPIENEKKLEAEAEKIGYPVILKASAGGGGKGLRLVKKKKELVSSFRLARSEAESSFDDPSVYIEKYIQKPHHIEVQILADHSGNIVYLGERECSIQRRYQKVLEETPSPFLDENIRHEMGREAVKVAATVDYRNAGTVEFVVDKNKKFYFLEMNTRLQVEHPVTEMVTGIDLVKCQIEIAAGLPLAFRQEDIKPNGYSLQCRIYAEDPDNDFMPSPGKILHLRAPSGGLGIRDDNGIYEGYEVPMEYDPLLSKLVTWGQTRAEAIHRMLRAISEYKIYGIRTTVPFFKRILRHPQFFAGDYNTHFIPSMQKEIDGDEPKDELIALIAAGIKSYCESKGGLGFRKKQKTSHWKTQGRWESLKRRP
ncbi:MAG: acetyl-CoA carboxylase biotin carboxylase subunit [Candidatus Aminicenantes bacterium]|nr:MAG: acetyl-CoA carboxylase biotin carboxylase subunit [Candidatus Aminicenantes bacterium]